MKALVIRNLNIIYQKRDLTVRLPFRLHQVHRDKEEKRNLKHPNQLLPITQYSIWLLKQKQMYLFMIL